MASDLFVFDSSFYQHSSSDAVSSEADFLFAEDQFSPFSDSAIDILQALSDHPTTQPNQNRNPVDESHSLDQISSGFLSSSPPSQQLESLSLCQNKTTTTQFQPLENNNSNLGNGYGNFSVLDALQVKDEECQMGFENAYDTHHQQFGPHSYSGGDAENVAKMMQRSYSSNCFDGKPGFVFQPRFDTLMESPNFQNQALSSPENSFLAGQMRRVCSTGDLQNFGTARSTQRSFSSPLASENSFMEENNFKVGKYSAEERKERISKYRAKRTLRNFNKTIKYACRKTLADNRPRIRGRFARNDETGEVLKASCSITRDDQDEDELWMEGLHEEEEDNGTVGTGQFMNSCYGAPQFQYHGF
ncbi:zinc finger protein CONSTANS-LIKE 2 isoform X1 [Ziziphus jujuba]|uniref:Zinc finger protein CONSTANS-LIKE 2 isoform X1 n=1 Tax=Ziziphus jujuba TaxID=326968 RepID=A0A6P4AJL0_ZIZJJ|nr:zinc finger protein CONSTANS-LIKE 2 isoform X1 [Ziziphus jujuba]